MMDRDSVFISYSHRDRKWFNEMLVHLDYLEKEHNMKIWYDEKISKGSLWNDEIRFALSKAKIAILLVSGDFLRSDFIINNELPELLIAAEKDGAFIYSVVVSDCMFHDFESISQYQAFNTPRTSLDKLKKADRNSIYVDLARTLKRTITTAKPRKAKNDRSKSSIYDIEQALYVGYILEKLRSRESSGWTIGEMVRVLKLTSRKRAIISLNILENANLVSKRRESKGTIWMITEEGKAALVKVRKSLPSSSGFSS